jgi:putative transposase
MLHTVEMKLYLSTAQERTLTSWLRMCCWLYNQALEQRIKAYRRRKESVGYNQQCALLTELRQRMPMLKAVPVVFARDALRRLDRGFQAFFRRIQAGDKPGFPRFRAHSRYHSLEYLAGGAYIRPDNLLSIPKLGLARFRVGDQRLAGKQKLLRILRRAGGWFAQVVVEDGLAAPPKVPIQTAVGIDVGLEAFATLDSGEKIANPRYFRASEQKLKRAQQRLCRSRKGSRNRRKAVQQVARIHERIAAQRKDFAHQQSRKIVNRFDLIGFEDLNLKGLARSKLAKSITDAAWRLFLFFVMYKAERAGRHAVAVDPRRTSQECPQCGMVKPKNLFERVHRCPCGLRIDRDEASARVIRARALGVAGASACGGIDLCRGSHPSVSRPEETGSLQGATHHEDTT